MRYALVLLAALTIAAGSNRGKLSRAKPGTNNFIDHDFTTDTTTVPAPFTYARTGNQTIVISSVMTTVAANVPAIDPTLGILLENAATNRLLRSEELENAAWSPGAGLVVTADQSAAPDGTTTMDLIDNTATTSNRTDAQVVTVTAGAGPYVASAWVKPFNASDLLSVTLYCQGGTPTACACRCGKLDGTACTCTSSAQNDGCVSSATVTTTTRLAAIATCTAGEINPTILLGPGSYNTATGKGYYWGAQLETGPIGSGKYPTGYVKTVGTTAARGITSLTAPLPAGTGSLCLDGTFAPTPWHPYSVHATNPTLFMVGPGGAANSWSSYLGTTGSVFFEIFDGAGTSKGENGLSIGADASSNEVTECYYGTGTLVVYKNGTAAAASPFNAGTGIWTATPSPATIYYGSLGSSAALDGYLKQAKAGRSTDITRY